MPPRAKVRVDDLGERGLGVERGVEPVAVGGLEKQGGGGGERRLGVLEDGHAVAADVAREAPGAALAVRSLAGDLDAGGAEQVPGAAVAQDARRGAARARRRTAAW